MAYMEKKPQVNVVRMILLSLVVVPLLGLLIWGGWSVYQELKYNTYFNQKEGFKIKYPKTWTVSKKAIPGMIAGFVSPKENALDLFLENVAITKTDLSKKKLSLDEYAKVTVKQMKSAFKNLKVEEPVDVELSGHPGKKIVLRSTGRDASVVVIYAFVDGDKAYNITYMGAARRYVEEESTFRDMINSLKVFF